MNRKTVISLFGGFGLVLVISLLGALVATEILAHYKNVVDGILGFVVWYLIYRVFISSKGQQPNEMHHRNMLAFPANIKFFIRVFLWTVVMYWALRGMYGAVVYLIHLMDSGIQR